MNGLEAIALVAEAKIQEALAEGAFDNLPGAGRPLVLEDDSHLPPETRMAAKILRNSGYAAEYGKQDRQGDDGPKTDPLRDLRRQSPDDGHRHSKIRRFTVMFSHLRREQRRLYPAQAARSRNDALGLAEASLLDGLEDSPYLEKMLDRLPPR